MLSKAPVRQQSSRQKAARLTLVAFAVGSPLKTQQDLYPLRLRATYSKPCDTLQPIVKA